MTKVQIFLGPNSKSVGFSKCHVGGLVDNLVLDLLLDSCVVEKNIIL